VQRGRLKFLSESSRQVGLSQGYLLSDHFQGCHVVVEQERLRIVQDVVRFQVVRRLVDQIHVGFQQGEAGSLGARDRSLFGLIEGLFVLVNQVNHVFIEVLSSFACLEEHAQSHCTV